MLGVSAEPFSDSSKLHFPEPSSPVPPLHTPVSTSHTMASLHAIPRFLLPRGPLLLRTRATPAVLLQLATLRHASTAPPRPKTLHEQLKVRPGGQTPVIPQPDKYRPPSHGRRTPRSETQQKTYGPKISDADRERMATKKYPNMMSPEGTFSHWFLNNKSIHVWISFVCSPACD